MTVIDLIIKLQQLPPNLEVKLDLTTEQMDMFKFGPVAFVDELGTGVNEQYVVISSIPLDAIEDEDSDEQDYSLN